MPATIRPLAITVLLSVAAQASLAGQSTAEDRAALFDQILAKTLQREAFSPLKNAALDLDVEKEMLRYRDELIAADTQQKLYYALARISNARKDRHLQIGLVEGGITLNYTTGVAQGNYPIPETSVPHAPIRFAADYGTPEDPFVFVSDFAGSVPVFSSGSTPNVGDKLVSINGRRFSDYVEEIEPYHRYSSKSGFWWQLATWIPQKSSQFPPHLYGERLQLELERRDGATYSLTLPYMSPRDIAWDGRGSRQYDGFAEIFTTTTFDLYRADDRPILLLRWHGFREQLPDDIDRLMEYAATNDLLDYAVIVDATRSRGGSLGAYAVRRLSPKPFKTTFGNIRISDVTAEFVNERRRRFSTGETSSPRPGEVDDGTWLTSWLEDDVTKAIQSGQQYSNNVPFKLAHLPKYSDGMIYPAAVHFRGSLVSWFGPYGGSHLDQFASIVVDNDLGHTLGMPAGGYSNTWEWEEVLHFPLSGQPVVSFMWSIGHTVRPNGQILEGNPAQVDDFVPLTRDNYESYYQVLLSRTLEHLGLPVVP